MKAKTINVQITRCPRQYESVRIGGEWSVDKNESEADVLDKALKLLNDYYDELMKPKQVEEQPKQVEEQPKQVEEQPKQEAGQQERRKLSYDNPKDRETLQSIVKRMDMTEPAETRVTLDVVLQYFEPDEQCMKILNITSAMSTDR